MPAASLVVVRERDGAAEVLLGRRASRHSFAPDVFVFPGGRIDRTDARAAAASELRPEVLHRLRGRLSRSQARAAAVAALRETLEETGLAFGQSDQRGFLPELDSADYIARAITPTESPIRFHAHFFIADAGRASGCLGGSGELLDLQWLALDRALALPVIDVTEFVLEEVGARLEGRRSRGLPLFHYRNGRAHVRYR